MRLLLQQREHHSVDRSGALDLPVARPSDDQVRAAFDVRCEQPVKPLLLADGHLSSEVLTTSSLTGPVPGLPIKAM